MPFVDDVRTRYFAPQIIFSQYRQHDARFSSILIVYKIVVAAVEIPVENHILPGEKRESAEKKIVSDATYLFLFGRRETSFMIFLFTLLPFVNVFDFCAHHSPSCWANKKEESHVIYLNFDVAHFSCPFSSSRTRYGSCENGYLIINTILI